jgi:hypothetical protein
VAYDIVSPTENMPPGSHGKIVKRRLNSEPADLRQGIANAYNVVTEVSPISCSHMFKQIFCFHKCWHRCAKMDNTSTPPPPPPPNHTMLSPNDMLYIF